MQSIRFSRWKRCMAFPALLGFLRSRFLLILVACCVTAPSFSLFCHGQLHFASIGNWGAGNALQRSVAETLKTSAKTHKLSFVVSPGSNFVSGTITDLDDRAWDTHYRAPFGGAELHLPFFTVLGSKDWRGNFSALAKRSVLDSGSQVREHSSKMPAEAAHLGPRWTLPNWWYHYAQHFEDASDVGAMSSGADVSLGLIFVDTYILSDSFAFPNITRLHWNDLRSTVTTARRIFDWVILVGDKALFSSGSSKGDRELRKTLGGFLRDKKVDAYISGNDYDMEIARDGNVTHINCGTGSSADGVFRTKASSSVYYVAKPGFCHHVLSKSKMRTDFIDGKTGNCLYSYTQGRALNTSRSLLGRFQLYHTMPKVTFIPIPRFGGGLLEDDWFVRFFGTIGLLVAFFLVSAELVTVTRRSTKMSQNPPRGRQQGGNGYAPSRTRGGGHSGKPTASPRNGTTPARHHQAEMGMMQQGSQHSPRVEAENSPAMSSVSGGRGAPAQRMDSQVSSF